MRATGVPAWVAPWVGRPFADRGRGPEFDCWGLVTAVVLERWGVELPSHAGAYVTGADRADLARVVAGVRGEWAEIPAAQAVAGDVVLLRLGGQECHVGLVVASGWMLHTLTGRDSCVESLSDRAWRNRVAAFFRHAAIAEARATHG